MRYSISNILTNQPTTNQPTNLLSNQPTNQPTNRPTIQSINQPTNQLTNQPTTNQPTNLLTNQQQTNQPTYEQINQNTRQMRYSISQRAYSAMFVTVFKFNGGKHVLTKIVWSGCQTLTDSKDNKPLGNIVLKRTSSFSKLKQI